MAEGLIKGRKRTAPTRDKIIEASDAGAVYVAIDGVPTTGGAVIYGIDSTSTTRAVKVNTNGELQIAGYSSVTAANRVSEVNPISQHYVGETLASVTDQADNTYYYYVDMGGYSMAAFRLALSCGLGTVTATVEGTLQDDGTVASSCTYDDITNTFFGVASLVAAAGSATALWLDNTGGLGLFKYLRIKIVAATGGAGAQLGDWTIFHKRMY